MSRAAVVIGVEKTGGLPRLRAVREGVAKMEAWAKEQGFEYKTITDANGPVDVGEIRRVIRDLVDRETLQQLLIYFAGHGVNIRFGEFWLLSGAPEDGGQAVNVDAAVGLARRCGIPHVVLLSDACRTAAEGIQAQSIDGNGIFPNRDPSGLEKGVDLFFATTLGAPSLEIRDPDESSKRYCAVYTEELVAALRGEHPESLLRDDEGYRVLRPRPLKKLLIERVPQRIEKMLGTAVTLSQTPDARITSDDEAWLARFSDVPAVGATELESALSRGFAPALTPEKPSVLSEVLSGRVRPVKAVSSLPDRDAFRQPEEPGIVALAPSRFFTKCGFRVHGVRVREAFSPTASVAVDERERVPVQTDGPGANVLIEFEDGRAVVLPALPGFVATLSFDSGELRNVAYEPSEATERWPAYVAEGAELTAIRTLIASFVHAGGFRLDREDAPRLTERIRSYKTLDPTLAVYAAYSYHNLGMRNRIQEMQDYLGRDLDIMFFDVAMLNGFDIPRRPEDADIFPFSPLLSQGWSLLDVFSANVPPELIELRRYVGSSLWTIFDPPAVDILQRCIRRDS